MAVTLTETAAREINSIIHQQDLDPEKVCLRVGVKGGGCSGFSYILDLTETKRDTDESWEFTYTAAPAKKTAKAAVTVGGGDAAPDSEAATDGEGGEFTITVVCDPKSFLYLNDTTIDFKDEVMGRGFVFNNPNATSSCGCGSSFAV